MHGYSIPAADALDFAQRLRRLAAANMLADIEVVADARRPLLTYAALVLEYIIRVAKPKTIVFSTFGVREGLLYEMLPQAERAKDGLICAAQTLNELLSRSARHAEELIGWTDRLVRVREAARDRGGPPAASCRLPAVGHRLAGASRPSRRGDAEPDHQRQFRLDQPPGPRLRRAVGVLSLCGPERGKRAAGARSANWCRRRWTSARGMLGAAFRVAHLISAARPGVLPATHFRSQRPQADAGVRAPDGRSRRRPRRQPLQATGAAGRPLRIDRAALGTATRTQIAKTTMQSRRGYSARAAWGTRRMVVVR